MIKTFDLPVWDQLREWLDDASLRADFPTLDVVTFGTQVRYGWDTGGYNKLLHFVHHRPREGQPPYRTSFPPQVEDIMLAEDGDYVQHWGIAETNLTSNVFAWLTWKADIRLSRLIQGKIRRRDLCNRLAIGQRVPNEGATFLVDYAPWTRTSPDTRFTLTPIGFHFMQGKSQYGYMKFELPNNAIEMSTPRF